MSDKPSKLVPATSANASTSSTPKRLYHVGNAMIQLEKIAWTKRYRPLQMDANALSDTAAAKMGVGVCSLDRQLAFEHALQPDEQVEILEDLNKTLESAGLLPHFFVLPDKTVVRPELIAQVAYGEVKLGWIVCFYLAEKSKPFLTCLLADEQECKQLYQSLEAHIASKL
jgi:hypothetical protein